MTEAVEVRIQRLPHAHGLPTYATPGSAGLDIAAAVAADEPMELAPGARALVPTGLCLAVPEGYEAQIRPRSGLALRHGLMLPNSPGTIDSDYRGELQIIVMNAGSEPIRIERGMKIAQLVLMPVPRVAWQEGPELDTTERGEGGFGSTGAVLGAVAASGRPDEGSS